MVEKNYLTGVSILFILFGSVSIAWGQSKTDSAAVNPAFKHRLATLSKAFKKDGYNVDRLFGDKRFEIYDGIGNRFRHSAERKSPSLDEYKSIIHFDEKIPEGILFIQQHREQLNKAQKEYHIPEYVISAIIGIESKFGQNIGTYNPFNVYVSMIAINYRADFARAQLKELLEFTHRKELDVFTLKSSYAGAMSYAQFIPYSVNKWWVGDDIFSMNDNIMSVANYLAYFKKRTGSLSAAVLRYNPSHLYRDAVLDLAEAIERKSKATRFK